MPALSANTPEVLPTNVRSLSRPRSANEFGMTSRYA